MPVAPLHRPGAQGLVTRQLEAAGPARQDSGEEAHQRAGVAAVDDWGLTPAGVRPQQFGAVHHELVLGELVHLDAEGAHGGDRRLGVRRAPESVHVRLAVAERTDQHGAV